MSSLLCLAATLIGLSCQPMIAIEPGEPGQVLTADSKGLPHWKPALCINNHPAPRSPDVSYAGLVARHGYQRDHIIPLCLGGPDTKDNLRYQSIEQAHIKDALEWQACEAYCRGEISLKDAQDRFKR